MPKEYYRRYASTVQKRSKFTVAAGTTFIKIRPGRDKPKDGHNIYSDIANDFNVGVMAGASIFSPNYRRNKLQFHLLGGVGYSSIGLNNYNTKGYIENEVENSAITLSVAGILEYNRFQFGIFSGLDMVAGEAGKHWLYKDRPWIGVGFGFSIFRPQGESDQKSESTRNSSSDSN